MLARVWSGDERRGRQRKRNRGRAEKRSQKGTDATHVIDHTLGWMIALVLQEDHRRQIRLERDQDDEYRGGGGDGVHRKDWIRDSRNRQRQARGHLPELSGQCSDSEPGYKRRQDGRQPATKDTTAQEIGQDRTADQRRCIS